MLSGCSVGVCVAVVRLAALCGQLSASAKGYLFVWYLFLYSIYSTVILWLAETASSNKNNIWYQSFMIAVAFNLLVFSFFSF